jgi:hypothetical protein
MARARFPSDEPAAQAFARDTYDTEETAAYVVAQDTDDEEQFVLDAWSRSGPAPRQAMHRAVGRGDRLRFSLRHRRTVRQGDCAGEVGDQHRGARRGWR